MKTTLSVSALSCLLSLLLLGCGAPQSTAPRASAPQGTAASKKSSEPARGPEARKPLTEDQRIAWEKLRRQYPEIRYWIVGYLTDQRAWRHYALSDRNTELREWVDGLGSSFKDTVWPNVELRMAEADLESWQHHAKRSREDMADLRARAAKEKKERGVILDSTLFEIAREEKRLAELEQTIKQAEARRKKAEANPPPVIKGLAEAEKRAAQLIQEPRVKAVAILDLFSRNRPFAVKWYRDEGKGPLATDRAFSPELDRSLQSHLDHLQKQADVLAR